MIAPAWNPAAPMVPVAEDGSLLHYPEPYLLRKHAQPWVLWEPMEARLTFEGFHRGRSAAYAVFRHEDGRTFPMMLADLEALLRSDGGILYGVTERAVWTVRKRGQNYGLAVVEPVP